MSNRRKRAIRRGGGGDLSLLSRVKGLVAGLPFFIASGHVTISGTGDVLSWHDLNNDAHVLTQSDTAKQVDPPAAHADYGGQLCLNFTGAQVYQSNLAALDWQFLSDGVSAEETCTLTRTTNSGARVVTTTAGGLNAPGTQLWWWDGSSNNFFCHVSKVSAAVINNVTFGVAALNTPTFVSIRLFGAGSPQYELRLKSALNASGNYAAAPAATAPGASLILGANNMALSSPGVFRIRSLVYSRALSDAQRAGTMVPWITQDTGIAA